MKTRTAVLVAGQVALSATLLLGAAMLLLLPTQAWPHQATNAQGQPLGITYPSGCCNSAATSPTGDCAPIDDRYVKERADGYHIDLPIGAHPKLKTKGYSGIVPYSAAKQPISNDYHICLSTDGANRYCFFGKPGAV